MFPKRLLLLTLFATLAVLPTCVLRAQSTQDTILNNFVFDSSGAPIADGWELETPVGDTANFVPEVPPGSNAHWSLELFPGDFGTLPNGDVATRKFTGLSSGIYQVMLWAKSTLRGDGGGCFLSINDTANYNEEIGVADTVWHLFTLTDSLILNTSDTLAIVLFAGDSDIALWRTLFNNITLVKLSSNALVVEPLTSNVEIRTYPNPFSQSTQITFTSQSPGYADVSIVNMLGVEVARLFSGELGAGEHSFTWGADETSAPRGVYECLVRMNGQVETLPVVLLH